MNVEPLDGVCVFFCKTMSIFGRKLMRSSAQCPARVLPEHLLSLLKYACLVLHPHAFFTPRIQSAMSHLSSGVACGIGCSPPSSTAADQSTNGSRISRADQRCPSGADVGMPFMCVYVCRCWSHRAVEDIRVANILPRSLRAIHIFLIAS